MEQPALGLGTDQREADGADIKVERTQQLQVERVRIGTRIAREAGLAGADIRKVQREDVGVDDAPEGLGLVFLGGKRRGQGHECQARRSH